MAQTYHRDHAGKVRTRHPLRYHSWSCGTRPVSARPSGPALVPSGSNLPEVLLDVFVYYGSDTEIGGPPIAKAFLVSSFRSERPMLELLDRGLMSKEYILTSLSSTSKRDACFVVALWTIAASYNYGTALRKLVALGIPVDMKVQTAFVFPGVKDDIVPDTALSIAAAYGHAISAEVLLQLGADPNIRAFGG